MGQELVVTCKQVGLGLVRLVEEGRMTREPGAVLGGKLQEGGRRTLQRGGSGRFWSRGWSFAINRSLPAMRPGACPQAAEMGERMNELVCELRGACKIGFAVTSGYLLPLSD